MLEVKKLGKGLLDNAFIYASIMWLLSRLVILIAMLVIAPALPTPSRGTTPIIGLDLFSAWDSLHYQAIATTGYEYANDDKGHNLAFFPLFPLIIRGLMTIGLPFNLAGLLVNNLAFLAALIVLYLWMEKAHGRSAARWVTAVLAWFPFSLYGTVVYTEGLYLLLSTAALKTFSEQQYGWSALWGALATATRPTGLALIPALLITSWKERKPLIAYIGSIATAGGLLLFSLYCALQFGDPLAFIHAQRGWRPSMGFYWQGWLKMLMQITVGTANWRAGWIKDPWHPLLFAIIAGSAYLLWRFRQQLGADRVRYGFCTLWLVLWLLAGDPLINVVVLFGGGYLLWQLRSQIPLVTLFYGFCGLGLILSSGGTWSIGRIAYGIVSLAIALGLLLSRYPRWGYPTLGFFVILLVAFAIRFAQHLWVA